MAQIRSAAATTVITRLLRVPRANTPSERTLVSMEARFVRMAASASVLSQINSTDPPLPSVTHSDTPNVEARNFRYVFGRIVPRRSRPCDPSSTTITTSSINLVPRGLSSLTIQHVDCTTSRNSKGAIFKSVAIETGKRCRLIDVSADWEPSVGGP